MKLHRACALLPLSALLWSGPALAVSAEVEQTASAPTIVVHTAPGKRSWEVVKTSEIPVLLRTRGRCNEGDRLYRAGLAVAGIDLNIPVNTENRSYSGDEGKAWRTHQLDLPAASLQLWTGAKPLAENKPLPRLSAAHMCNQALSKRQGAQRAAMLAQGEMLRVASALSASFALQCQYRKGPKHMFHEWVPAGPKIVKAGVDVLVKCAPMTAADAPQPRTQTKTKGPPPRHGKPAPAPPPLITAVKLRAEVSQSQSCPDSLRLVGGISAGRAHRGAYIFLGNHYLSAKSDYDFDAAGHRSVVATRKLNWNAVPKGLAAGTGAQRTMQGWVQLNVQPQDGGKVFSSEKVPFKVNCKAPAPPRARPKVTSDGGR